LQRAPRSPRAWIILKGRAARDPAGSRSHSEAIGIAYLAATGLPLLLSSRCTVFALGVVIIAGSVAAYIFYWEAFVSVWCFFAAAASVVILMYFEQSRRTRVRVAGA
jgi:hypothetical protein